MVTIFCFLIGISKLTGQLLTKYLDRENAHDKPNALVAVTDHCAQPKQLCIMAVTMPRILQT